MIGVVFEVLVVFHGAPGAASDEAVFDEQAVAEVAFIDLVAELLATDGQGHHRHDMGQKRKEDTEDPEVERTRIQLLIILK